MPVPPLRLQQVKTVASDLRLHRASGFVPDASIRNVKKGPPFMWEYLRVEYFDFVDLDSYGQDGWELVGIEPGTWKSNPVYVFKRKLK
ncbi:MAG: hypothetical protein KGL39_55925 [Patescibacteria group bacterium]|nr:hypothetical protein [Patescibacteria group bacterium]